MNFNRIAAILTIPMLTGLMLNTAYAQVDMAQSKIVATSKQMSVPMDGTFKKFSAQVDFDVAKPETSHASFNIDTGSYDLGDPSYNQQVIGGDWFDAAKFPTAAFVSAAITPSGDGAYNVAGKLTIKGITKDVVVPVKLTTQGTSQIFDGVLPIKRLDFNIGSGDWKDTSIVADEVLIKFHIVNNP